MLHPDSTVSFVCHPLKFFAPFLSTTPTPSGSLPLMKLWPLCFLILTKEPDTGFTGIPLKTHVQPHILCLYFHTYVCVPEGLPTHLNWESCLLCYYLRDISTVLFLALSVCVCVYEVVPPEALER